ncbi:acyl-CoA N-acyltransferase [Lipomyces kononenkoae]|uniref:Acyl-CoA N-acyltransferase n=1 Tax=Lipomyces kononenkoae TaxID=34357 RepID=A0ACC3SXM9_LIPKO
MTQSDQIKKTISSRVAAASSSIIIPPAHVTLRDDRRATIYAFVRSKEGSEIEVCTSATERRVISSEHVDNVVRVLMDLLNHEIELGQTYPQEHPLTFDEFKNYWFLAFTAVMVLDSSGGTEMFTFEDAGDRVLGTFYVKPNYPGICGGICNAGFLVGQLARGQGVGKILGKQYVEWAPKLGYTGSIFNLVFETNIASQRIWDGLGFEKVGRVKKVAWIKGREHEGPVDAIIYGMTFKTE